MILIGGGFTYRKIDDFYLVGLPDPRGTTFGELVDTGNNCASEHNLW